MAKFGFRTKAGSSSKFDGVKKASDIILVTGKAAIKAGRAFKKIKSDFNEIKKAGSLTSMAASAEKLRDTVEETFDDVFVKGGGRIGIMNSGTTNFSTNKAQKHIFALKDNYNTLTFSNSEEKSYVYKTRLCLGRKSSRKLFSINDINNNLTTRCFFDTERDYIDNPNKSYLTSDFGFNQRRFDFLLTPTHTTVQDFKNLLQPHDLKETSFEDIYGKINMYGNVMNEKYDFSIRSESDHYLVRVKINLVKVDDYGKSLLDLYNSTFHSNLDSAYEEDGCCFRVPIKRQLRPRAVFGDFKASVITDIECSLGMSDYFSHFGSVIKTFSKVLKPGDIWNFSLTYLHGPGLYLNKLYNLPVHKINPEHPTGYAFVIQLDGDPRGSITRLSDNQVFNGNSPGKVTYSFKRSINYLLDTNHGFDCMSYRLFKGKTDNFSDFRMKKIYEVDRESKVNVDIDDISWSKREILEGCTHRLNYAQHTDLPASLKTDEYFTKIGRQFYKDHTNENDVDELGNDIDEEED